MCGICGVLMLENRGSVDKDVLKRMNRTMVHRGPDDEGYFMDRGVGLAMRRLIIIDLKTGHQPISNEDGSVTIVFNGEIYNYRELRAGLEKRHRFSTRSDTEVIIHLYEEMGEKCLERLNGMFAFAIWDSRRRRLFLARDRMGIKPLHYAVAGGAFVFGSEIKAIMQYPGVERNLDREALHHYMGFEFIPAPLTIYRGVKKLRNSRYMVVENGKVSIKRYWRPVMKTVEGTEDYYVKSLKGMLEEAVRLRLVSDVPLGAFLSGGIDSSIIVSLMSSLSDEPVKTFSMGFEEESFSELDFARLMAERLGTNHHEHVVKADVVRLLPRVANYFDEPFADVSAIPTYLVSRMTRKGVKVALSGDGGDEIFGGYDRYLAHKRYSYYRIVPGPVRSVMTGLANRLPEGEGKKGGINMFKRFVQGAARPESGCSMRWQHFLTDKERRELFARGMEAPKGFRPFGIVEGLARESGTRDWLGMNSYIDLGLELPDDGLTKVDRMSMANSLEVRTPFLDYNLVQFVSSMPTRFKIRGRVTKYILKEHMGLPREIAERGKYGFSMPVKNWLRRDMKGMAEDILLGSRGIGDYFRKDFIGRVISMHAAGRGNYSHMLWCLLNFELWRREHLD